MTTSTAEDAIRAATSVASDIAEGRLSPSDLERQAVAELRELVGTVVGEGDPLFALQQEIARGVLAVDGIPTDELSEWLAVARQKAGEATQPAALPDCPSEVVSLPSGPLSASEQADEAEPVPEPESAPEPEAVEPPPPTPTTPPRYDALRGWDPGATRRY